jgi:hypothetical protein
MPAQPLSDELALQAAEAYQQHGTKQAAADALGLNVTTFKSRLLVAATRGLLGTKPVLPGFEINQTSTKLDADGNLVSEWVQQRPEAGEQFEAPAGHVVKGVSALVDPDGRVKQQWIKTREGRLDPLQVAESIKQAFAEFEPAAAPVEPPSVLRADMLTLLPLADWHIGMFAWKRETSVNWDLEIAERVISEAIDELISLTPTSGEH